MIKDAEVQAILGRVLELSDEVPDTLNGAQILLAQITAVVSPHVGEDEPCPATNETVTTRPSSK